MSDLPVATRGRRPPAAWLHPPRRGRLAHRGGARPWLRHRRTHHPRRTPRRASPRHWREWKPMRVTSGRAGEECVPSVRHGDTHHLRSDPRRG